MYGGIQSGPRRQLNIGTHAKQIRLATVIAATIVWTVLLVPQVAATQVTYVRLPWEDISVKAPAPQVKPDPAYVTQAQAAWIDTLEECESRDNAAAINPKDRDGTPSYYAFQFKPGTFRSYGVAYGVIPAGLTQAQLMQDLKSTELQRDIVEHMLHDPSVDWHLQFPVCVQLHGVPPGVVQ